MVHSKIWPPLVPDPHMRSLQLVGLRRSDVHGTMASDSLEIRQIQQAPLGVYLKDRLGFLSSREVGHYYRHHRD